MLEPIDYQKTASTGYYFRNDGGEVEHLRVEHPTSLLEYIRQIPKLHSIAFDFRKSAYRKKKGFVHFDQIKSVLENVRITRLSINGSDQLESLPDDLFRMPLQYLKISGCPKLVYLSASLHRYSDLVEMELIGEEFDFGPTFPRLRKLESVSCKKMRGLAGLSACRRLQKVIFQSMECEEMEESRLTLPQLEELSMSHMPNLASLPEVRKGKRIQRISLYALPKLESISLPFRSLKSLEELSISGVGSGPEKLSFPMDLYRSRQLRKLQLRHVPFHHIPDTISHLSRLQELVIERLQIQALPEVFDKLILLSQLRISSCLDLQMLPKSIEAMPALEQLTLENLPELEIIDLAFHRLLNLRTLWLKGLSNLQHIDASLARNEHIQTIHINGLTSLEQLPPFGTENGSLSGIEMSRMPKLKALPDSLVDVPLLESLKIQQVGISQLPPDMEKLCNLRVLDISAPSLAYLPESIGGLTNLTRFSFRASYVDDPGHVLSPADAFKDFSKVESMALRRAIIFWTGNGVRHLPMTSEMRTNSIGLLSLPVKNLHLHILSNVHFLNRDQRMWNPGQIESESTTVWINGQIEGGKNAFKSKLVDLGPTLKAKFAEDVDVIVLGKKATVPEGLHEHDVLFTNQQLLETLSAEKNPGLLQKKDAGDDIISNLQHLLWSADPDNVAVALEIVKNHGLPSNLQDDFLLVAKTCKDKNVKSRVRSFLRSKLDESRQKALAHSGSPFAIQKLASILPAQSLANMHYTDFRRTGRPPLAFLNIAAPDHYGRREIFEALLPGFLTNTKYLNQQQRLTREEWNEVFSHHGFQGKIRRVVINLSRCREIPEMLFEHIDTIKIMQITIGPEFPLHELYRFYKLNVLNLRGEGTDGLPMGLGALDRLRELLIHFDGPVHMPSDLVALKHLKKLMVYRSFENVEDFRGKLPLVNI